MREPSDGTFNLTQASMKINFICKVILIMQVVNVSKICELARDVDVGIDFTSQ